MHLSRLNPSTPLITALALLVSLSSVPVLAQSNTKSTFQTIQFPSADGLEIVADVYRSDKQDAPWIVLCHQAGWSRGEYREIAPKLQKFGFHCLAIDQRSGGEVNGIKNATAAAAQQAGRKSEFVNAEQDILAAIKYTQHNLADGADVILWGSSYSAALAIRVAGEQPDLVDGVLAFAPGEYFQRFGKPEDWIGQSAANIKVPVFITSAKREYNNWKSIFEAIPGKQKVKFVPETKGNHGSRALYVQFDDSMSYWTEVYRFLTPFKS